MTKLCWNADYGPMPVNAEYGRAWWVIHVPSGEELHDKVIYVDDDTGEIWRYEVDARDRIKIEAGRAVVEKLVLGPGKIRLERRE